MYKTGDKVTVVKYPEENHPFIGKKGTVTVVDVNGFPCISVRFDNEDGSAWFNRDEICLTSTIEPSVCTCSPTDAEDESSVEDAEEETFFFTYTHETDSGTDSASASLRGDKAGELVHVLDVFRSFLQRAGYSYVVELNAVTEDGTWHSSSSAE